MQPLFSIVIANYNFGRFLGDAIESVIAQDMGDAVELIICDAASTDNSVEVIKKYACGLPPNTSYEEWRSKSNSPSTTHNSQLLTWWCSEKDGGQSAAFNKGFSHAHGRFLTWLNADDIMTKGALKAIAKEIDSYPKCEWFIGSSLYADADLRITRCFCAHCFSRIKADWYCISAGGPSSFFTKRLLDRVGGVDESLHYVMDTDLWYKFYRIGGVQYRRTTHNIFAYRQHEASKMSGADHNVTARALGNRRKARLESSVLNNRHSLKTGWRNKVARFLSFSIFDNIIALCRTVKWKGRYAMEI